MNQKTQQMEPQTHNEAIAHLQDWKQKLEIAYQDLVVNGEFNKNSKYAIENRIKAKELAASILVLQHYQQLETFKENMLAMILGTITVTITAVVLLVVLAMYLQKYFQENNIDFEFL